MDFNELMENIKKENGEVPRPACILNNAKQAKKAGASTEEIIEAFAAARFAKSASAMASSMPAFEWLANNK
jgi:alkylhydroperoxidase/carboxymuconolactone decarboxylase family protein YurZ